MPILYKINFQTFSSIQIPTRIIIFKIQKMNDDFPMFHDPLGIKIDDFLPRFLNVKLAEFLFLRTT